MDFVCMIVQIFTVCKVSKVIELCTNKIYTYVDKRHEYISRYDMIRLRNYMELFLIKIIRCMYVHNISSWYETASRILVGHVIELCRLYSKYSLLRYFSKTIIFISRKTNVLHGGSLGAIFTIGAT